MRELAEMPAAKVVAKLTPMTVAYQKWIDALEESKARQADQLREFGDASDVAIANCKLTLKRIQDGLRLLESDPQATLAFQFMNRAMWLQRTIRCMPKRFGAGEHPDFDRDIDVVKNRSWRPFQIAFILLNLPGITRLDHPERSDSVEALSDLLFFPTGGGKTEAYWVCRPTRWSASAAGHHRRSYR